MKIPEGYEDFVEELNMMRDLSKIIRSGRDRRGQIEFDVSEVEIKVDEEENQLR